jgi:hypothetical protein
MALARNIHPNVAAPGQGALQGDTDQGNAFMV